MKFYSVDFIRKCVFLLKKEYFRAQESTYKKCLREE